MWHVALQCFSSLRFYDTSSLQTEHAENSQLHVHSLKTEPARELLPGGGGEGVEGGGGA